MKGPSNNEMQLMGRALGSVRIRARIVIVARPTADLGVGRTLALVERQLNEH
jgi:hypothetical protein